jgi:hypothetical protein
MRVGVCRRMALGDAKRFWCSQLQGTARDRGLHQILDLANERHLGEQGKI